MGLICMPASLNIVISGSYLFWDLYLSCWACLGLFTWAYFCLAWLISILCHFAVILPSRLIVSEKETSLRLHFSCLGATSPMAETGLFESVSLIRTRLWGRRASSDLNSDPPGGRSQGVFWARTPARRVAFHRVGFSQKMCYRLGQGCEGRIGQGGAGEGCEEGLSGGLGRVQLHHGSFGAVDIEAPAPPAPNIEGFLVSSSCCRLFSILAGCFCSWGHLFLFTPAPFHSVLSSGKWGAQHALHMLVMVRPR